MQIMLLHYITSCTKSSLNLLYKTKLYSLFTKQYYSPEFGGLGQEAPELASNPGNNCVDPDVYKRTYYTSVTGYFKKITNREFHQTK